MRLIDADALMNDIDNDIFNTESRKCYEKMRVRKQPTIDAEPVRHGRWIFDNGVDYCYKCSECKAAKPPHYIADNYCPNCGAKMDEEVQE